MKSIKVAWKYLNKFVDCLLGVRGLDKVRQEPCKHKNSRRLCNLARCQDGSGVAVFWCEDCSETFDDWVYNARG